jgi:hypothetical protein
MGKVSRKWKLVISRGIELTELDGGFCQSSGHEGDFVSVRRPYAWTKGKYTYRLTRRYQEEPPAEPPKPGPRCCQANVIAH